eukprot:gnl/Carplike_NY0171/7855_a10876_181.p1 GENE.gnl/Carplike_NY0171/7855_a10876_181~~gnl/Carplike_NY0171/7855_a10876_181.p1  ORF type:complete len:167 (+),score=28.96 gnl/Carplike_NY0171/7855_a10876_181:34-534(+)
MSVHFFYNYRDELVKKLKEHYEDDVKLWKKQVAENKQLDEAEQMLKKYFKSLVDELEDVIEASNREILLCENGNVMEFKIQHNFVRFTRQERAIQVKVGYYVTENDMVETAILGYVVPGDKRAVMKKVGKIHDGSTFDENTINYYLRSAFSEWLQSLDDGQEETVM